MFKNLPRRTHQLFNALALRPRLEKQYGPIAFETDTVAESLGLNHHYIYACLTVNGQEYKGKGRWWASAVINLNKAIKDPLRTKAPKVF